MPRAAAARGAAAPPRRSPWRMVVSTAVTVAVLVVVFVGIFPQVADYFQAWSSIRHMPTAYLVALVVATVANSAAYVWPLQAALPGWAGDGRPPQAACRQAQPERLRAQFVGGPRIMGR